MSPAEVIAALPEIEVGNIQGIERIKHGLTNESWLVHCDAGVFVVRMSHTAEAALQINRSSEALILETVARAGIGPDVICCDPSRHLLVTRYAGETWTSRQATQADNIERIALLLRRLHALSPPPGIRIVDLSGVTLGYEQTLDRHGVICTTATPQLRSRAAQVAALLRHDLRPCLCHNDVHALNIVDHGSTLRLIDWEYAGLGERMFDLASICMYHEFSPAQRELLLTGYLGRADPQAVHRLELSCWLFGYIRDLWTAVREL